MGINMALVVSYITKPTKISHYSLLIHRWIRVGNGILSRAGDAVEERAAVPSGMSPLLLDFSGENSFLFDNTSLEFCNNVAEHIKCENQLNRTEAITKALEEIEANELIKEEPFGEAWLEERTYIPIFGDLSLPPDDDSQNNETSYLPDALKLQHHQPPQQQQQQYHTQSLLEEFETVLGDIGACHQVIPRTTPEQTESLTGSSTLTPPESPQQDIDTQLLITLQPLSPEAVQQSSLFPSNETEVVYNTIAPVENPLYVNNTSRQWNTVENISLGDSLDRNVANDFAVVEEYVRSHTKDIPSPSSPCNSSSSSSAGDTTDDPDWNVVKSKKNNPKPTTSRNHQKFYRQYFRPSIEDKKVRKKEQNKNAATRYRQKKKQELRDIEGEERDLTETNGKLKDQVTEIKREIKCLKGLLRELYKAKGVL